MRVVRDTTRAGQPAAAREWETGGARRERRAAPGCRARADVPGVEYKRLYSPERGSRSGATVLEVLGRGSGVNVGFLEVMLIMAI